MGVKLVFVSQKNTHTILSFPTPVGNDHLHKDRRLSEMPPVWRACFNDFRHSDELNQSRI